MVARSAEKKNGARTVSLSSQPFNFPQAHSNSTSVARSSDMLVFEQLLDQRQSGNLELIVLQEPLFCGGVNVSKPENSCFLKISCLSKSRFHQNPCFQRKKVSADQMPV